MSEIAKNTPQGTSKEVIGSGISNGVVNQLIAREELIAQKTKTRDHLLFFNGNGAWARMVSSVNTLTEAQTRDLAVGSLTVNDAVGDNSLAWNNVLMGGTLKQGIPNEPTSLKGGISEEKYHNPIEIDNKGYIKRGDLRTNAYHNYESLGFRPTPGIQSVSVKSKGTYGTLREAEVNCKVWTLEDLEVMQALYLRPGYTVLLEWGHSLQLDSDSKQIISEITTYKKFLNDKIPNPMLTFEKELARKAQESDFNYDSFVGYVSNFNWSLNEDGGYDCTVNIIAKGSILESIACTFDTSKVYPPEELVSLKTKKGEEERKSIYHKLFTEIQYWVDGGSSSTEVRSFVAGVGLLALPGGAGTGAGASLIANSIEGATNDTLYDSDEELLANLEEAEGTEAKIASQDQAFKDKFDKLLNGDTFTYNGQTYTFTSTEFGNRGFAELEEEPAVYYLNRQFKEYGITFNEGVPDPNNIPRALGALGNQLYMYNRNDITKVLLIDLNNTFQPDDRRQSLKLANFIQDNVQLPEEQLTEEQKADRERRNATKKQLEQDRKRDLAAAKEAQAVLTGLQSEGDIMPIYTKSFFTRRTSQHFKKTLNDFVAFRLKDLEKKGATFYEENEDLNEFWIPLSVVLDVFNNYVTLIDETREPSKGTNTPGRKLTQFYTGWQDDNTIGPYEKKAKYLTSDLHFSINPMVCVLPKKPRLIKLYNSKGEIIKWPDKQGESFPMGVIWKNGFHQQVESAFVQGLMRGDSDDILNILISTQFLKDELDRIVKTNEDSDQNENNNIVSFLRIVLRAMNEAMGGVNDLDIFFDEQDDLFYIVDRKVTPITKDTVPTLTLSGTNSVISNVNISSQISKNIGNMVSIAAQGTEGNSRDNVASLLKWNSGLLDRHIRHKAQSTTDSQDKTKKKREERKLPEDKRLEKWIEDYYDFWREFNGDKVWDAGDFNADVVPSLSNYHKEFCQKYVVERYYKNSSDPKPPPGVIPVELSFTTMGISGIKIGQAFRIKQGLLPQRYAEDFGYIITGLSHNIQDSKWTTDVKTQFYIVNPPDKEELESYNETNKTDSEGYKETAATGASPATPTTEVAAGEDPAPIINPNKIGAAFPNQTPVFRTRGINLRNGTKEDVLKLVEEGELVQIGNANNQSNIFANYTTTAKLLDGKYYLEATAARQARQWFTAMDRAGIPYFITSAVRYGVNTGGGAHGYGIALDFGNLNKIVEGSTDPNINRNARIQNPIYTQIAELGANFGWYNPWRLSDSGGTQDEIWHFEYWGRA